VGGELRPRGVIDAETRVEFGRPHDAGADRCELLRNGF
jgi:hypothetical protein